MWCFEIACTTLIAMDISVIFSNVIWYLQQVRQTLGRDIYSGHFKHFCTYRKVIFMNYWLVVANKS